MYAYAATEAQVVAQEFLTKINDAILFPLITLLMALALLIFLYGAFEYVKGAGNDAEREKGKRHLLYGTIGMLVMLSAYAILSIAAATFGLEQELDDATNAGTAWDGGFFSFGDDDYSDDGYDDRAPYTSESSYENDVFLEDTQTQQTSNTLLRDDPNNPFVNHTTGDEKRDESMFKFHAQAINEAYGSDTLSFAQVKAFSYQPKGEYSENFSQDEQQLLPYCQSVGGSDVFSISVNQDTGRQFYCVGN